MFSRETCTRKNRGASCRKRELAESFHPRPQKKARGLRRMLFPERADTQHGRKASSHQLLRERSRSSRRLEQKRIPASTRGGGDRGGTSECRFRATQKPPFSLPLPSPHTGAID